jgi:competence protein ComEC
MKSLVLIIFCSAYILGLISTKITWGMYVVLGLGVILGLILPRLNKKLPKLNIWIFAGVIGLLGSIYLQARIPQPLANDISKFVAEPKNWKQEQVVTINGKIITTPKVTRSGRSQFILAPEQLTEIQNSNNRVNDGIKKVTGKLYVNVPLLQATGLYEGENITVNGVLSKPQGANNPGAFDWQNYLAQDGIFAILKGKQVILQDEPKTGWSWLQIRSRIVKSQVQGAGFPEGILISAMVLGNKVIDLPYYINDYFRNIGLSHALAASGFQLTLILGVILSLSARLSPTWQFLLANTGILIFLGLAGLQPALVRAFFMGEAVLIGLLLQRGVKSFSSLLIAAILMLIWQPLWIWDLGFQFSFSATLGLIVSATPIAKKFDLLPPTIAGIVGVTIAAFIWTIPIQLYHFGLISPYCLLANLITAIPITLISIGAFISAIASLFSPSLGSVCAWLLFYPTNILIKIVEFFNNLPGNSLNLGTIAIYQLIILYGILICICLLKWWQKRWWFGGIMSMVLLLLPLWYNQSNLAQLTVLSAVNDPVLVIQDHGQVTLVNSGDENTVKYAVLPFLQQQGINQIDLGLVIDNSANNRISWEQIFSKIKVKNLYFNHLEGEVKNNLQAIANLGQKYQVKSQFLQPNAKVSFGGITMNLVNSNPVVLQMQIFNKNWLLLGKLSSIEPKNLPINTLTQSEVLWWNGDLLKIEILSNINPKIAIATQQTIDNDTLQELIRNKIKVYSTGRDGAIQWTQQRGFYLFVDDLEKNGGI